MSADSHWMPLRCASCQGIFKIPNTEADQSVECPHCGALVAAHAVGETVRVASPISGDSPLPTRTPRKIQDIPASSHKPRDLLADKRPAQIGMDESVAIGDSHLPPVKAPPEYEAPEMIVEDRNSLRPPALGERDRPDLDHLERLASTQDEQFALTPEEAARYEQQMVRRKARSVEEKLTRWEDGDEANPDSEPLVLSPVARIVKGAKMPVFLTLMLLLAGLIAYGYWSMNSSSGKTPVLEKEEEEANPTVADDLNKNQQEIEGIVRKLIERFLAAENYKERLAFIRDPERVEPLMEKYYVKHDDGPIEYRKIRGEGTLNAYQDFAMTTIELKDFSYRNVAAERIDGEFKVDWESFVGYSESTFESFKETKPTEPLLFRVKLGRETYFNYDFLDDNYACFAIEDPKSGALFYGYTDRNGPIAKTLFDELPRTKKKSFGVVKLRYPTNPKTDNQVIIDEYVQKGWVIRDTDPDERPKFIDELEPIPNLPPAS